MEGVASAGVLGDCRPNGILAIPPRQLSALLPTCSSFAQNWVGRYRVESRANSPNRTYTPCSCLRLARSRFRYNTRTSGALGEIYFYA